MELIYVYVERFRNIRKQWINFSDKFRCRFSQNRLFIQRTSPNPARSVIFKDSLLSHVNLIVGKTGSGKTNFLQLIGMPEYEREDEDRFFLVFRRRGGYKNQKSTFFIELHNMKLNIPLDPSSPEISFNDSGLFQAIMKGNEVSALKQVPQNNFHDVLIVNCYDKDSFTSDPYPRIKKDDFNECHWFIPRHISPYGNTNVGIACDYIKRYLKHFPPTSIKWEAALEIKSQNWAKRYNSPIGAQLLQSQYWTYSERKWDEEFHPRKRKSSLKEKSNKEMFLHDLLADFALYLREFLEYQIKEENLYYEDKDPRVLEIIGINSKPNAHHSPDNWGSGSTKDLIKRIEWLAMMIDGSENGDLFPDGRGVVWQMSSDIIDIYKILNKLPEKYFSLEKFSIPVKEIKTGKGEPMEDLFERMTGYIPDDSDLFPQQILPYNFTCLSSGEYQYAKVLGAIDEYCIQLKLQSHYSKTVTYPDFILLLDEPETYMHPEMARRFLWELNEVLKRHKQRSSVQVIMTSHSPFMLSDLLPSQITTLDYNEDGYCRVKPQEKNTFAADFHSILAHEFFLKFTIGEFSRELLTGMLERLRAIVVKEELTEADKVFIAEVRKVVPNIGDPLIRSYFESLLFDS